MTEKVEMDSFFAKQNQQKLYAIIFTSSILIFHFVSYELSESQKTQPILYPSKKTKIPNKNQVEIFILRNGVGDKKTSTGTAIFYISYRTRAAKL